MISGALLLKKDIEPLTFYKKRLQRIIIPTLAWSLIYIGSRTYPEFNPNDVFSSIFMSLLREEHYHLWYMYALFGAYICIPFMSRLLSGSDFPGVRLLVLFTALWYLFCSVFPTANNVSKQVFDIPVEPNFRLSFFQDALGYIALGALLNRAPLHIRYRNVALVCLLVGYGVVVWGNYWAKSEMGTQTMLFGYYNPFVVIIACATFYLFRYTLNSKKSGKMLQFLASLTLGIYLCHPLVMTQLLRIELMRELYSSNFIVLRTLVTFLISGVLTYVIMKMPVVRRIV